MLCLLHDFGALLPLVRLSLLLVVLVCLAHHHDILATSGIFPINICKQLLIQNQPEGVRIEFDRVKVGIRVRPFSLDKIVV